MARRLAVLLAWLLLAPATVTFAPAPPPGLAEVAEAAVEDAAPDALAVSVELVVPDEGPPEAAPVVYDPLPTSDESRTAFEALFPAQAAASASAASGGDHWAVLIGINRYVGRVGDLSASRQDAERLRSLLLRGGWYDDHIVLLTDADATGTMIREALSWLARTATPASTVIVHFSGHSKKWYGGGGSILDMAIWPTDDDFVRRDELAAMLAPVRSSRLWANFATCNAEGIHLAGLGGPGRVVTYSSETMEKSYEDPSRGFSVWGSYLLEYGMWEGQADLGGDTLSVQAVYEWAAPQATQRTSRQRPHGPQRPVLVDDLGSPFVLNVGPARLAVNGYR